MKQDIFKNAFFGKPYKTRDGRKALYLYYNSFGEHALILEGDREVTDFKSTGLFRDSYYTNTDIVSEWKD